MDVLCASRSLCLCVRERTLRAEVDSWGLYLRGRDGVWRPHNHRIVVGLDSHQQCMKRLCLLRVATFEIEWGDGTGEIYLRDGGVVDNRQTQTMIERTTIKMTAMKSNRRRSLSLYPCETFGILFIYFPAKWYWFLSPSLVRLLWLAGCARNIYIYLCVGVDLCAHNFSFRYMANVISTDGRRANGG